MVDVLSCYYPKKRLPSPNDIPSKRLLGGITQDLRNYDIAGNVPFLRPRRLNSGAGEDRKGCWRIWPAKWELVQSGQLTENQNLTIAINAFQLVSNSQFIKFGRCIHTWSLINEYGGARMSGMRPRLDWNKFHGNPEPASKVAPPWYWLPIASTAW